MIPYLSSSMVTCFEIFFFPFSLFVSSYVDVINIKQYFKVVLLRQGVIMLSTGLHLVYMIVKHVSYRKSFQSSLLCCFELALVALPS